VTTEHRTREGLAIAFRCAFCGASFGRDVLYELVGGSPERIGVEWAMAIGRRIELADWLVKVGTRPPDAKTWYRPARHRRRRPPERLDAGMLPARIDCRCGSRTIVGRLADTAAAQRPRRDADMHDGQPSGD
jgi:hypothetical protein